MHDPSFHQYLLSRDSPAITSGSADLHLKCIANFYMRILLFNDYGQMLFKKVLHLNLFSLKLNAEVRKVQFKSSQRFLAVGKVVTFILSEDQRNQSNLRYTTVRHDSAVQLKLELAVPPQQRREKHDQIPFSILGCYIKFKL